MGDDTPRCDEEAPEIQASATLEGGEDDEAELDHVPERDAVENDDGDELAKR